MTWGSGRSLRRSERSLQATKSLQATRRSLERSIEASEVNLGLRVGNFDFREATRGLREATSDFL